MSHFICHLCGVMGITRFDPIWGGYASRITYKLQKIEDWDDDDYTKAT